MPFPADAINLRAAADDQTLWYTQGSQGDIDYPAAAA